MDGGDMLFGMPFRQSDPLADILRKRAHLVARAAVRMGLAAVNVGRFDLLDGLGFVQEVGRGLGVPWVSTNLRRGDGTYPFPRFRIVRWGSRKVAVLGFLRPDPDQDRRLSIQVADPVTAAREILPKLPAVDGVICLSSLGMREEQRLASAVPAATAIIGGGSGEILPQPMVSGSALILHAGEKGRYLGVLDLKSATLRAAGRSADGSGGYAHRVVALDASVGEDREIASWVRGYHRAESASRQRATQGAVPPSAPPPAKGTEGGPFHVGTSACRKCHGKAYESWLRTPHARSFASLAGRGREAGCQECHAVLLSRAEGTRMEPDVACEACHGLGGKHRGRGNITRQPGEDRCRSCHRGYHEGKRFDYRSAYQKIKCEGT